MNQEVESGPRQLRQNGGLKQSIFSLAFGSGQHAFEICEMQIDTEYKSSIFSVPR